MNVKWIGSFIVCLFLITSAGTAFTTIKLDEVRSSLLLGDSLSSSCEKVPLLDSVIQIQADKYNFNGCILLVENGKIIYEKAVGFANYEQKIPMENNALFQLASVSKQFTAMGIMILRERGLLKFEDSVTKYIPDFPYPDITITHLLHHTSGLPEYVNGWRFDKYFPKGDSVSNQDLVDIMRIHRLPKDFKPGTRYKYSNTGYAMLGLIIEKASGTSYPEFMKHNIFEPLHMYNTFCYADLVSCSDGICRVNPYKLRQSKSARLNNVTGDKGIFSSIWDMYRWDQALYTDQLVSFQTLDEAFSPTVNTKGDTINYGYGWRIYEEDGKRCVWHRGLWESFNPAIMRFVDEKRTIIILANIIPPYSCSRLLKDISAVWTPKEVQTASENDENNQNTSGGEE